MPCSAVNADGGEFEGLLRSAEELFVRLREAHEHELQAAGIEASRLGVSRVPAGDAPEGAGACSKSPLSNQSSVSPPCGMHSVIPRTPLEEACVSCETTLALDDPGIFPEESNGVRVVTSPSDAGSMGVKRTESGCHHLRSIWRNFQGSDGDLVTPKRVISRQAMHPVQRETPFSASEKEPVGFWRSLCFYCMSILCFMRGRRSVIITPDSTWRFFWDISGACLIGWDVFYIPLEVFSIEEGSALIAFGWFITMFWTCDIVASFCVGYYKNGSLIMNQRMIAKRYLLSWFALDSIIVSVDWLTAVGASNLGLDLAQFGRLTRAMRIMRCLRLLRLLKLQRILTQLQEHIYSEYIFILTTVAKLLVIILVLNHFIACSWFLIGNLQGQHGWVHAHIAGNSDTWYKYSTSLHWSLTQFMPASMEVNPSTSEERVFAICVLMVGMVAFSSFVSNITNSMTSLRNLRSEDSKQLWLLRRFMQQQKIGKTLSTRVYNYLEFACYERRSRLQEKDIKLLGNLSEPLRDELHFQLKLPHLERHPLFGYLCGEMKLLMHRLCRIALHMHSLASKDVLFYRGDEAFLMYFFISGELEYEYVTPPAITPKKVEVQCGDWICEAALWTTWRHVGELRACRHDPASSNLLSVNSKEFCQVVGRNSEAWVMASAYGARFVETMSQLSLVLDTFVLDKSRQRSLCSVDEVHASAGGIA